MVPEASGERRNAQKKPPAEVGRLCSYVSELLVRSSGSLEFLYCPCQERNSAGPASSLRLVVDRASDPALDSAGRVGSDSSCCFLSWERHKNGSESAPFR
jgi:hypothetical protein